jgi:hypothetical protein
MRRIRLVVGMGVVMAALLALSAGPAMADDFDFEDLDDVNVLGNDVVLLDEDVFVDEDVFDDDLVSPFVFDAFVSDCPFAGDFEGIVNQFDCFDDGDDFGDVILSDEDVFDDVVLLVDDDFDHDGDRDRDHPRRHHRR